MKYAIPKFFKCKSFGGKFLTIQHAFIKFVRLFHCQSFTLYGNTGKTIHTCGTVHTTNVNRIYSMHDTHPKFAWTFERCSLRYKLRLHSHDGHDEYVWTIPIVHRRCMVWLSPNYDTGAGAYSVPDKTVYIRILYKLIQCTCIIDKSIIVSVKFKEGPCSCFS